MWRVFRRLLGFLCHLYLPHRRLHEALLCLSCCAIENGFYSMNSLLFLLLSGWAWSTPPSWLSLRQRSYFQIVKIYNFEFLSRDSVSFIFKFPLSGASFKALSRRTTRMEKELSAGLKWSSSFNKSLLSRISVLAFHFLGFSFALYSKRRIIQMSRDMNKWEIIVVCRISVSKNGVKAGNFSLFSSKWRP